MFERTNISSAQSAQKCSIGFKKPTDQKCPVDNTLNFLKFVIISAQHFSKSAQHFSKSSQHFGKHKVLYTFCPKVSEENKKCPNIQSVSSHNLTQ